METSEAGHQELLRRGEIFFVGMLRCALQLMHFRENLMHENGPKVAITTQNYSTIHIHSNFIFSQTAPCCFFPSDLYSLTRKDQTE